MPSSPTDSRAPTTSDQRSRLKRDRQRVTPARIATTGWQIPAAHRERFAPAHPNLARYAGRFTAVEISSSFYRPHRRTTYERWAATTPAGFRFAVKLPGAITHEAAFVGCLPRLDQFLAECTGLGDKLGVLLVQTPGSQMFAQPAVGRFLSALRRRWAGGVALEPRHASWFSPAAEAVLAQHRVARVVADPLRAPTGGDPSGWRGLTYVRLHGSPRHYESSYDDGRLEPLAARVQAWAVGSETWCVFDNTRLGHATGDALRLAELLGG